MDIGSIKRQKWRVKTRKFRMSMFDTFIELFSGTAFCFGNHSWLLYAENNMILAKVCHCNSYFMRQGPSNQPLIWKYFKRLRMQILKHFDNLIPLITRWKYFLITLNTLYLIFHFLIAWCFNYGTSPKTYSIMWHFKACLWK